MDTENKAPQPAEHHYSREQVKEMISVAHAQGWNDAVGGKINWSDTSRAKLDELLFKLFNFKM